MKGKTELVYLPEELFRIVETVRNKLGMNRSAFYRHCIMTYLESRNLLSAHMKTIAAPRKSSASR